MQQVKACEHSLDLCYKGETCEAQSVLAIGCKTCELVALVTRSILGAGQA
jgi:hypothetical protein